MKKVTAGIIVDDGCVLIARRPLGDELANKWEFPGGKIEDGETPQECLKRELMEEFGIQVRVGEYLCSSIYAYKHGEIELLAYLVLWGGGILTALWHDKVNWVLPADLKNYEFAPADIPIVKELIRRLIK